jgi:hypothetical protein
MLESKLVSQENTFDIAYICSDMIHGPKWALFGK